MEGSPWPDQLAWVKRHSPLTARALSRFATYPEVELLICFHIDLKMIPVIESLADKIHLSVIPCNKTTIDSQGWSYLKKQVGIDLLEIGHAFERLARAEKTPRFLCDLGGELICRGLDSPGSAVGGLEGTTTGISRIRDHLGQASPSFPIIDWNSAPLKMAVHNEKMVGFSLWQTFTELTRLSLHGKKVGVLGFGAVGRGIARTARHLGGNVSVYDPTPAARTLASFEGFPTLDRQDLIGSSEVLVTATGRCDALTGNDLKNLRDGAFLCNAGHGCDELSSAIRHHGRRRTVLRHVEELELDPGRCCYLLARGELVNLAAGFGDTINGFDLTSAQLIQAIRYLLDGSPSLPPGWHELPTDFISDVLQ